jgi:hypothetical protein
MIERAVWLVLANAGALLLAHAAHRRMRTGVGHVDLLLFLLLHLLLLSASVLAAGLTGLLTARGLGIPWTIALGLLVALGEHRRVAVPARPDIGRWTLAAAGIVGVRMLAQVWFYAPFIGDAHAYHLPKVAEWVRAGRFTREMGVDLAATFPAGFELVETWWTALLHHDVLIELAGVEYVLLAVAGVRSLGVSLGLSARAAWTAATLYALVPLVNLQATACLNDAPVAALVIALFALAASNPHPALMAIPFGLLLGTKATGCFAAPGILLLWAWNRRGPRTAPACRRTAAALSVLAAGVGVFWYLRNALWYGDPVYPVHTPSFLRDVNLFHVQTGPTWSSLHGNLSTLVSSMVRDDASPPLAISTHTSGWGWITFSIGAVALVLEARRDGRIRRALACFVISVAAVLATVNPDHWFARFVLFFPAIASIAAAGYAEGCRPASFAIAAGAVLQFLGTAVPRELPPGEGTRFAGLPWRERSLARLESAPLPDGPLAVYALLRTRTYGYYGPDYSRDVVYLRLAAPKELPALMRQRGLSVVRVNLPRRLMVDFQAMVTEGTFRALEDGLYELAP